MFGQDTCDVIVNHHDLIGQLKKLLRKNTNRGRAATNPHALFDHAIDNGRTPSLNHKGGTTLDT